MTDTDKNAQRHVEGRLRLVKTALRARETFGYGSPEEEQAAADSGPVGFVFDLNDLPSDCEPS